MGLDRYGEEKISFPPTEFEPQPIHCIASHITNYTIVPPSSNNNSSSNQV